MNSYLILRFLFAAFLVASIAALPMGANAQTTLGDEQKAALYFREAKELAAKDNGQLWGVSLDAPILFVDPQTRHVIANQPDSKGLLTLENGVYVGVLPPDLPIANTSVSWDDKRWVMLLWEPSTDASERHTLFMHESWHRIQKQIGLPDSDPRNIHLDTFDGRYWLQLEWRALARALSTKGDAQRQALTDALLFRRERFLLNKGAADEERTLEMHEGLAEYTGVRLSGMSESERHGYVSRKLDHPPAMMTTFTRSFAYLSGPAYGLLLDTTETNWRQGLTPQKELATLLQDALKITLPQATPTLLAERTASYGGDALRKTETERDTKRKARQATLQKRFVTAPLLIVPLVKFNMSFNPSAVEPVGTEGTYYTTLIISDTWGKFTATNGAFLTGDYKMLKVSLTGSKDSTHLSGDGWKLELAPGWIVIPDAVRGNYRVVSKGE